MNKDTILIVAAIILAGAMIGGAVVYDGQNNNGNNDLSAAIGESDDSAEKEVYNGDNFVIPDEDDDAFMGNADAPVVIIGFTDFECPFCASFHENTFPQIKDKYMEAGKVKFVYRDFPLPFHLNAQKAAEATECAREQGKYWEIVDAIFVNQGAIEITDLKKYAVNLGLNAASFNFCLDSGKYAEEIKSDYSDGALAGVSGTPSFFINGEFVVGAQPFESFQEIIERKLQ